MKKLRLNKLFHWLYAFLMLYPVLCFFGTWLVVAFNNTFVLDNNNVGFLASQFFNVIDESIISFDTGSVGEQIHGIFSYVLDVIFGPEITNLGSTFTSLLTHWVCVSVLYLVFDVLMYLINLVHRWIDEGGF